MAQLELIMFYGLPGLISCAAILFSLRLRNLNKNAGAVFLSINIAALTLLIFYFMVFNGFDEEKISDYRLRLFLTILFEAIVVNVMVIAFTLRIVNSRGDRQERKTHYKGLELE